MTKNKCFVCGGISFRADRALSGRLICISCGNPYGVRRSGTRMVKARNSVSLNKKNLFFAFIFFAVIVIILL